MNTTDYWHACNDESITWVDDGVIHMLCIRLQAMLTSKVNFIGQRGYTDNAGIYFPIVKLSVCQFHFAADKTCHNL